MVGLAVDPGRALDGAFLAEGWRRCGTAPRPRGPGRRWTGRTPRRVPPLRLPEELIRGTEGVPARGRLAAGAGIAREPARAARQAGAQRQDKAPARPPPQPGRRRVRPGQGRRRRSLAGYLEMRRQAGVTVLDDSLDAAALEAFVMHALQLIESYGATAARRKASCDTAATGTPRPARAHRSRNPRRSRGFA